MLYWDDDKIYMASRKGYTIMDKNTGGIVATYSLEEKRGSNPQMMAVSRGRCLVVTNNNRLAQFLMVQSGQLMARPAFVLDPQKQLMQLVMIDAEYVVAVYDTSVAIYHQGTGDLL